MATLSDVAAEAGLSPTTVSRYLNRRLELPVATRERIDAAIAKLDYRPNVLARRLSTGRAEALSLVTPNIANAFFAQLAAAIEAEARKDGYALYVSSTGGEASGVVEAIHRMSDRHVDGLIMVTDKPDDGTLAALLSHQENVVILDEDIPGVSVPRVFVDNEDGAYLATRELIQAGHRDIAMVGGPARLMSVTERLAGFTRALEEEGISVRPGWALLGDYSRQYGRTAGSVLLDGMRRPTAVFAGSDDIALGLIESARGQGLSLPEQLSIVAFDDVSFADLVHPALTTIRQPVAELGRLAVRHLLALIEGSQPQPPAETRLPVQLILRQSVAPPQPAKAKL
jgi:LacI family transcriptional regulator